MTYNEFLESKKISHKQSGFETSELHNELFPFQKFCVKRALKAGKFALFEDCGLGKTFQQLVWADEVSKYTNMPVLILAPLAVTGQTIEEAGKFDIGIQKYDGSDFPIQITNYDQIENVNSDIFSGVVLDESSILKNFEGKTKGSIIDRFNNTPYKLACSATPSPNDPMELGNHAEFLNIMSRNEVLSMYFVHDGGETSKWRLKGHCEQLFWDWVSTWAIMLGKPSDIGFSDEGYVLPGLNIIDRQVKTDIRENGKLFNDMAISATNYNSELRITTVQRLDQIIDIVNNSQDNFLISIKQNQEADYLKKVITDCREVRGNDDPETKEKNLLGFGKNEFRCLITKAKIVQFGMNYQNCHNVVIASPDFSFEAIYQLLRRCLRFGQNHVVNAYIITTDTMQNVIDTFNKKHKQFSYMQKAMTEATNKNLNSEKNTKSERQHRVVHGENYSIELGDCVQLIKNVPDNSIGFSIFSPPFAELYTYSDELEDMGNSKDYNEFLFAFKFLVNDLLRVIQPGRNVAVHCMDLPIQKGKHGFIGLRDFSGMIHDAFVDAGFIYHTRVTIWKNPVTEMQRTKALGLLHKQVKKDAAMSRVGIPDYLLVFRKPGEAVNPVKCDIPVDLWQQYASPVWMDIDYGDTLNCRPARSERDEKHICPLQLQTIHRAVHLWTNKGDTVLTPFMGIGSEIFESLKLERKGIGFELKESYFNVACKNLSLVEQNKLQSQLIFE